MNNEGRNTYVKRQLTAALLELLKERELRDISVREIAQAAGVHRVSFYRNFTEKEDILREYTGRLLRDWQAGYEDTGEGGFPGPMASLFAHFKEHQGFYLLLYRQGMSCLLLDTIKAIAGPKPEYANPEAYGAAFVSYGLYGWIDEWFRRGMAESPEEVATLLKERVN